MRRQLRLDFPALAIANLPCPEKHGNSGALCQSSFCRCAVRALQVVWAAQGARGRAEAHTPAWWQAD